MAASGPKTFNVQFVGGDEDYKQDQKAVVLRIADDAYTDAYIATLGVDFKVRTSKIDGEDVKIKLWPENIHQRFARGVYSAMPRPPHGYVVCVDMKDPKSLENAKQFLAEINRYSNGKPIIISGTNSESPDRKISEAQLQELAESINAPLSITDAKSGKGTEELLKQIAVTHLKHYLAPDISEHNQAVVRDLKQAMESVKRIEPLGNAAEKKKGLFSRFRGKTDSTGVAHPEKITALKMVLERVEASTKKVNLSEIISDIRKENQGPSNKQFLLGLAEVERDKNLTEHMDKAPAAKKSNRKD